MAEEHIGIFLKEMRALGFGTEEILTMIQSTVKEES